VLVFVRQLLQIKTAMPEILIFACYIVLVIEVMKTKNNDSIYCNSHHWWNFVCG
jgi:hypothetical protein